MAVRLSVPCLLAVVALCAISPRLLAQSPEDRRALQGFRDSLETTGDSVALVQLEQRLIVVAKADRNNPINHLRLGFLAVRLGDLGSKSRYDDGAGEFQWATELVPTWPWAWYGLGIAEDRVGDSQISIVQGLQAMFGKDHLTRAANAYARSVQEDPSFVDGLVELAATALRQRINIKTDIAREALRQAAATSAAANPEVLLYRGRVEREVGDVDSALAAFRGYLAKGGRHGLGELELARTEFLHGSLDGQRAYYDGAESADSGSVGEYRADLALIANDSALAEFDHNTGERRAAFLRRFWGQRDRGALLREGERLREHYRRLYYARRNFQLVSANRHYDIVERYRSGSREYDDRGLIYIRHGEPTQRATYSAPGMELNESWHYRRADGDLVFHFMAREDVQDYKLVESLFDVLGFSDAVALRGDRDNSAGAGLANELLTTRDRFAPVYSRLIAAGTAGSQKYLTEERMLGRRSIALGTRTDSYELTYARQLKVSTDVVVAGRDSTGSLMHVTYAIPGSALHDIATERGHVYPVRVRLSVTDRTGRNVASVDTTTLFLSRDPVPSNEHLVGKLRVPVIPGPLSYRLAIEQGDESGVMLPTDTLTAGDFSGQQLEISGLVLGSRAANLTWRPAPGDTVWFNPLGRYRRSTEMELYYEVYGLEPGAPFQTTILVTKQGGGGFLGIFGARKPAIRLGFEDHAQGLATHIGRSVALDRLSSGRYWIEVVVKDAAGGTRTSRAAFEVIDR
ncbi:MAG: GWxTD domain-containing protein [Gemmatimonadota bacterium]